MTRSYVLSGAATADLREITSYTVKRWGKNKCSAYMSDIEQCTDAVAKGVGFYKDMTDLYPDLRMEPCQHHYIFCLPRQNAPALVIAILHERMDIITRLKLRLTI